MTPQILRWLFAVRKQFPFSPGRVLEVGSLNVNGSPRSIFGDATEYIGLDMQEGPGVDRVMNAGMMKEEFGVRSCDTLICCEMLEHDINFMHTIWQISDMVRRSGHLIITTPTFGFPLHRYPKDYWRFGEDTFREVFFAGFEILDLEHLDDISGKGVTLAAIGRKL